MMTHSASPGSEELRAEGPVLLTRDADGVAHIRLNRPEVSNALSLDLLKALDDVLMQVQGDGRVRSVFLSGAGKHFCAGGDVQAFRAQGRELPAYIRAATGYLASAASTLMRLDVPVVTAVQGFAAGGGGLGLVCSSDIVVAGRSSSFLAGATRVAMAPDAGAPVTLTQLVGFRKAMEILLLNPVIGAEEALALGLITRVVDDANVASEALSLARQLAAGPTKALGATKRLLWNGLSLGVEASMAAENHAQTILAATEDVVEGLSAVIEKRAPRFAGR